MKKPFQKTELEIFIDADSGTKLKALQSIQRTKRILYLIGGIVAVIQPTGALKWIKTMWLML